MDIVHYRYLFLNIFLSKFYNSTFLEVKLVNSFHLLLASKCSNKSGLSLCRRLRHISQELLSRKEKALPDPSDPSEQIKLQGGQSCQRGGTKEMVALGDWHYAGG